MHIQEITPEELSLISAMIGANAAAIVNSPKTEELSPARMKLMRKLEEMGLVKNTTSEMPEQLKQIFESDGKNYASFDVTENAKILLHTCEDCDKRRVN